MKQRPVVVYTTCEECGASGVVVGPQLKRAYEAAQLRGLERCVECGAHGRGLLVERGMRPDAEMWPEAAELYDLTERNPAFLVSPSMLV
jgi:hypothetical protein